MRSKKSRRLQVIKVLIFAVVSIVLVLWTQNRLLPKARLTSALSKTVSDLKDRFRGDPLLLATSLYHPEGKYSADVQLVTQQETAGQAEYNMTVYLDATEHHMKTEGIIKTSSILLDVSAYLGKEYIAVSSDKLTDEQYYGITYETFASDVRKVPLLGSLINERVISEWDTSLKKIRKWSEKELVRIPDFENLLLKAEELIPGFMTLPCNIEKEVIQHSGAAVSCHRIDYHFPRAQIERIWQGLDNIIGETCQNVIVSFFLHGDSLIRLSLTEDGRKSLQINMGIDIVNQPIQLHRMCTNGNTVTVSVDTRKAQGWFEEIWEYTAMKDGKIIQKLPISYKWHSESGGFSLQLPELTASVSGLLQKTDTGLRLETKNLTELLYALLKDEDHKKEGLEQADCVITVKRGAQIIAPEYINIDDWTIDTFLTILGSLGSLIGVSLY